MQPAEETENADKTAVIQPKAKNSARAYIEKTDAKHKHRFQARNIFLGVAIASIIVFVLEVAILGIH